MPSAAKETHDRSGAIRLNTDCACVTLDAGKLQRALAIAVSDPDFGERLLASHPHLVSAQPVFLSLEQSSLIASAITAIETAIASPAYAEMIGARGPETARYRPGPRGIFMGYDFHLAPGGPRLIEINTNAGGGLVNAYAREAHQNCCQFLMAEDDLPPDLDGVLAAYMGAFHSEWRRQRPTGELRRIAIVDDRPEDQYLYPEFLLFARLFRSRGLETAIADPSRLEYVGGKLMLEGESIDLVYNRLTDFYFTTSSCAALRDAYLAGDVVVTPNPWAHANYADKRNLAILSDRKTLESLALPAETIETILKVVPHTRLVTPGNAEEMWTVRDKLFFKPWAGFGGKAAYRGDKLTRKVFAAIAEGGYVAQEIVAPSLRTVMVDSEPKSLKTDLRAYTYDGRIALLAARLYQGQTTNFRTEGGGFAPVLIVKDVMATCYCR